MVKGFCPVSFTVRFTKTKLINKSIPIMPAKQSLTRSQNFNSKMNFFAPFLILFFKLNYNIREVLFVLNCTLACKMMFIKGGIYAISQESFMAAIKSSTNKAIFL